MKDIMAKRVVLLLFLLVSFLYAMPASAQVEKATVKIDGMI